MPETLSEPFQGRAPATPAWPGRTRVKGLGKPFTPVALSEPCPKCGGAMLLRRWDGEHQVRCQAPGCRFGFDADPRGRPAAGCPACGEGWLKTTPKGRVCAHCGQWDNGPDPSGRSGYGPCPRCKTGQLNVIKGEYGFFMACSDLGCGLTYTCDSGGRSEGGRCKACRGPVRRTRSGARVCLACETWQEPKPMGAAEARAARPAEAPCAACGNTLRAVWTRRNRWVCRCDACAVWVEPPAQVSSQEP